VIQPIGNRTDFIRIHTTSLKNGITRTPEFERKGLAQFAVNVGTKCGHLCTYCSTDPLLRLHPSFKAVQENPFETGYAIVDPTTPERVARDAHRLRERGLMPTVHHSGRLGPGSPKYHLGRKSLQAILSDPHWSVRILTKNAAVKEDFELIAKYQSRVLVSLSLTAPPDKTEIIRVVEPFASPIPERMAVLQEAHRMGLRTYGMFCPLLPGIADDAGAIEHLTASAMRCGAEEIFVEPVNARGPGLKATERALSEAGFVRSPGHCSNPQQRGLVLLRHCVAEQRSRGAAQVRCAGEVAVPALSFLGCPGRRTMDWRSWPGRQVAGEGPVPGR
jgi:DNA repair photolyase